MKVLEELLTGSDSLFEGFFEWLEDQYDPATGGFFYARSSERSGEFTPDIESTAQALSIIERSGRLECLDDGMRGGLIRFFQSRQDPVTGYFYDADPNMRKDEVMVGRALGYSLNALKRLGAGPLYPLPKESGAAPSYMHTPEAYGSWLRSVSLANSWRGCDRLCNSAPYIGQMKPGDRKPFLRTAFDYFTMIQDPDTGLWGEGSMYVRISGTFKLHTFYNRFRVPLPRTSEMYRSILTCLHTEVAFDMCYVRNPISLLSAMEVGIPSSDMLGIAAITVDNLAKFKRADGGFSREKDHSPPAPNVAQVKAGEYYPEMPAPVPLGKGEVEGDMNAGTQALLIRSLLHQLTGIPPRNLSIPGGLFAKYR